MLQSDLCDCSDEYIFDKGTVADRGEYNNDRKNISLAFKNNAPFISCISKINNVLIEDAEGLDVVMTLYNLL